MKNTIIIDQNVLNENYVRAMITYFSILDKILSGVEIVDENQYNEDALPTVPTIVCFMQSGEVTVGYKTNYGIEIFRAGYYVDSKGKFDSIRIRNWIASSYNNYYPIYQVSSIGLENAIKDRNEIVTISNNTKNRIMMYTCI